MLDYISRLSRVYLLARWRDTREEDSGLDNFRERSEGARKRSKQLRKKTRLFLTFLATIEKIPTNWIRIITMKKLFDIEIVLREFLFGRLSGGKRKLDKKSKKSHPCDLNFVWESRTFLKRKNEKTSKCHTEFHSIVTGSVGLWEEKVKCHNPFS